MHVRAPAGRRPAPGKFLYIQIQSRQFDGRRITVDPFMVEFTENCIRLDIVKPGQHYTSDSTNSPARPPHRSVPASRPPTQDRVDGPGRPIMKGRVSPPFCVEGPQRPSLGLWTVIAARIAGHGHLRRTTTLIRDGSSTASDEPTAAKLPQRASSVQP